MTGIQWDVGVSIVGAMLALKMAGGSNRNSPPPRAGLFSQMAEREGFEPSVEVSPHTRLAGENTTC